MNLLQCSVLSWSNFSTCTLLKMSSLSSLVLRRGLVWDKTTGSPLMETSKGGMVQLTPAGVKFANRLPVEWWGVMKEKGVAQWLISAADQNN